MATQLITLDQVIVASAGTAVPITTDRYLVSSVTVTASLDNTGKIYVGDIDVDSSNGQELLPGDSITIDAVHGLKGWDEFFIDEVYIDASTSGNSARVTTQKRRQE